MSLISYVYQVIDVVLLLCWCCSVLCLLFVVVCMMLPWYRCCADIVLPLYLYSGVIMLSLMW